MPPPPLPVDRPITVELLGSYTPEQLATRSILHPDYAGFEEDFNWRQYIVVSLEGEIDEQVEATLNQISQTADGQQLIRQAAAVNAMKPKAYGSEPLPFLFISDHQREQRGGAYSHYDKSLGNISIQAAPIRNTEYQTTDDQWHDFSVQRTVVHELFHAANPDITRPPEPLLPSPYYSFLEDNGYRMPHEGAGMFGIWQNRLNTTNNMISNLIEGPVIGETNRFMATHYGENSPRKDHTSWRTEPAHEAHRTTQPNLGADHFYNEIEVPEVPDVRTSQHER